MNRRARLIASLATALVVAGCSLLATGSPSPRDRALQLLAQQRQTWQSRNVASYEVSINESCFCPESPTYRITVIGGMVTNVTDNGQPVDPAKVANLPKTVPELFALVASLPPEQALDVAYDTDWGFPLRIAVDPVPNAVDDEYTITAARFEPLPQGPPATPAS